MPFSCMAACMAVRPSVVIVIHAVISVSAHIGRALGSSSDNVLGKAQLKALALSAMSLKIGVGDFVYV
jgi:hypothetical protein